MMYLFVALIGKFIRKWRLEKLDVTQCLTAEWSGINHFFSLHLRIEIGTNRNFGHFIFAWLFPFLLVSYSLLLCRVLAFISIANIVRTLQMMQWQRLGFSPLKVVQFAAIGHFGPGHDAAAVGASVPLRRLGPTRHWLPATSLTHSLDLLIHIW